MKKVTGIILGSVCAIGFIMMTANTDLQARHHTGRTCKWKQFHCEYSEISFEACIESGDGKQCDCGAVTRDCGGNNSN